MKKILFPILLVAVLTILSCGKKAPPKLFDTGKISKMTVNKAEVSEGKISFSWEPVVDVVEPAYYDIYRSAGDEKFTKISTLDSGKKDSEGSYVFSETSGMKEGEWYHYIVASMDKDGNIIRISDTIDIYYSVEPSPPSDVKAVLVNNYVRLMWLSPTTKVDGTPIKEVTGYNVYRKKEDQKYFRPINATLITKNSFIDMSVQKDNTYYYIVRAVDNYIPPWHESRTSDVAEADFPDLIPPEPPALKVIGAAGRISLSWQKSSSDDVLGYKIYRSTSAEGEYENLNQDIASNEYYDDMNVEIGKEYFYKIKAVDNSKRKNESAFSNIVSDKAF
ncbi:MAG: hypothetical protein HZA77_15075 [Candidatus Schekmanbacteria bacterium]|nr:hypothetical protein [Candidatus Schekmanbacteria bacterium]